MTWWKSLEPVYKAAGILLGAMGFGMTVMALVVGFQTSVNGEAIQVEVRSNATAHSGINYRIDGLEGEIRAIGVDLTLVRCWAFHEIQGTDPAGCLVSGSGGGS